jgi:seryl-tRNA synthetase
MIDLGLLRSDTADVIARIKLKDPDYDIEKLVALDQAVRVLKNDIENVRSKKNELAKLGQQGITEQIRTQSIELSRNLKLKEQELEVISAEFTDLYLRCPNIPMKDLPSGGKEANQVVKVHGQKPIFKFEPKNHVELGKINKWFDFEAATRMTGSNFALYTGEAVTLVYKLMMFMLNNNMRFGFNPVLPPYLVNEAALIGASNFPRFSDEVYAVTQDKLFLTPTAEVNLTSMYRDHIFLSKDLPVNMTAWTSCFRREAGGYGAHERGLIRIHQFEKVELYTITEPEQADQAQQRMVSCAENILQALGLHYRISLLAAQDCSFASAKTYDIEVWMPGQQVYKEVSSASNCTDFQARRSAIRYKKYEGDKTHLVTTLNASSLALPRLLVALMETYQQEDGTIKLPEILHTVTL